MAPKETTQAPAEVSSDAAVSLASLGVTFDSAAGYFLDEDEKKATLNSGIPFLITQIDYEEDAKFGARWVITIVPQDDQTALPRGWQFSAATTNAQTGKTQHGVIARNASFEALAKAQSQVGGRPVGPVVFVSRGGFRTIEDPTAPSRPANGDELSSAGM